MSAPFVVEMVVAAGLLFGIPDAGTSPVDGGQATAAVEEDDEDDGKPATAWEPTAAQKAAMFFGIPDTETDDINDPGHWAQILGFCDALHASGRDCGYDDGTPECQAAQARNRPCGFNMGRSRSLHWMRRWPEQSWQDRWGDKPDCPVGIHPSSLALHCRCSSRCSGADGGVGGGRSRRRERPRNEDIARFRNWIRALDRSGEGAG